MHLNFSEMGGGGISSLITSHVRHTSYEALITLRFERSISALGFKRWPKMYKCALVQVDKVRLVQRL